MQLSKTEVWSLVHAERARLVEDLRDVDADAWQTPSLCGEWSVHDVLAHLLDTALTTRRSFVWGMLRARGDFHRANREGVRRYRGEDGAATLAAFAAAQHLTHTPPAPIATRLVEAYVHGEDIRRPLGIEGDYSRAGLHEALQYQLRTGVSFDGGRERAAGRARANCSGECHSRPSSCGV